MIKTIDKILEYRIIAWICFLLGELYYNNTRLKDMKVNLKNKRITLQITSIIKILAKIRFHASSLMNNSVPRLLDEVLFNVICLVRINKALSFPILIFPPPSM